MPDHSTERARIIAELDNWGSKTDSEKLTLLKEFMDFMLGRSWT